jgi:hypothetical protein
MNDQATALPAAPPEAIRDRSLRAYGLTAGQHDIEEF